ncbi:MAG: hypothetical protein QY323_03525 [Patescibacteria group bacterium]|nr:MAG: hypothetical protein QY323_03525 [Patescibacteria group bacterium]
MFDPVITLTVALVAFVVAALAFRFLVWPSWQEAAQEQRAEEEDAVLATESCRVYDLRGRRARHRCGHVDHVRFRINLWGRTLYDKRGWRAGEACGSCILAKLLEVTRRCCDCGHAIVPGQMVKVCADGPEVDTYPQRWKSAVDGGFLGCLRGPCFGEGYRMAGWWMGDRLERYQPKITFTPDIADRVS